MTIQIAVSPYKIEEILDFTEIFTLAHVGCVSSEMNRIATSQRVTFVRVCLWPRIEIPQPVTLNWRLCVALLVGNAMHSRWYVYFLSAGGSAVGAW